MFSINFHQNFANHGAIMKKIVFFFCFIASNLAGMDQKDMLSLENASEFAFNTARVEKTQYNSLKDVEEKQYKSLAEKVETIRLVALLSLIESGLNRPVERNDQKASPSTEEYEIALKLWHKTHDMLYDLKLILKSIPKQPATREVDKVLISRIYELIKTCKKLSLVDEKKGITFHGGLNRPADGLPKKKEIFKKINKKLHKTNIDIEHECGKQSKEPHLHKFIFFTEYASAPGHGLIPLGKRKMRKCLLHTKPLNLSRLEFCLKLRNLLCIKKGRLKLKKRIEKLTNDWEKQKRTPCFE